MKCDKQVGAPPVNHFKSSRRSCVTTQSEEEAMANIPYSSAISSLMYAAVCTRVDITDAVVFVSRHLSNPGEDALGSSERDLKILEGTSKLCLFFGNGKPILKGLTDADMVGDLHGRRSTWGNLFTFAGRAVSW